VKTVSPRVPLPPTHATREARIEQTATWIECKEFPVSLPKVSWRIFQRVVRKIRQRRVGLWKGFL
jgi:hypothetical protein